MTIAVENSTGTSWFVDGSSFTFTKTGINNALIYAGFSKINAVGRTLTSLSWGSQPFTIVLESGELVASTTTSKALAGYILDSDIPSGTSEAITAVWAGGNTQIASTGAVMLVSGVDQTTPERDQAATSGIQIEVWDSAAANNLTYTAQTGDLIVYTCVDSATTYGEVANFTKLVTNPDTGTSQMDEGAIYYRIAGSNLTNQTIPAPVSGSTLLGHHHVQVYRAAPAGGGITILNISTDNITEDGEQNAVFSTSGFSGAEINSVTIGKGTALHTGLNISSTGWDGDVDIPDVTSIGTSDTLGSPFSSASHSIEAIVSNGTDTSDPLAITHNPKSGYQVVEVSGVTNTEGKFSEEFVEAVVDTSQVLFPTADNTSVDADGDVFTDKISGTIDMWFWHVTDETWKRFTWTITTPSLLQVGSQSVVDVKFCNAPLVLSNVELEINGTAVWP